MAINTQTAPREKTESLRDSSIRAVFKDLYQLTKPTITLLVVVTAVPGIFLAHADIPSAWHILITLTGAGLASASAAVFNQVVERKTDLQMQRTYNRSLPGGRISGFVASFYGVLLGVAGFALLWQYTTPLAAWVALGGHLFYVVIYTMILKKRTVQNIVIGGAAGAVGPLIGWASVTGTLTLEAWILFLIIFLWTPPHFWALALKYKNDYAKAKIPMYPVVHGDAQTRKVMFLYTLSLIPTVASLYFLNAAGVFYLLTSGILTLKFSYDALKLWQDGHNKRAMPLFHYSCVYTFAVFAVLTVDSIFF